MNIDRRRFLLGLAATPFLPACGDTAETNVARPTSVKEVTILAQSWGSSQVIAKIAELLLREQIGVARAKTTVVAESEIWTALSKGDAHACLEVWPLRNSDGVRSFVDTGRVANLGTVGSGRTAWFVPDYVVEAVPEITTPTVVSGVTSVLSKAQISSLLVGPSDWITPSPSRLGALGVAALPVQPSGTEKALLDQVRQLYAARTPFMVSLWYPHPLHSLYGFQAVGLPAAAGCDVNANPFGCDYPAEPLLKVGWPGLKFSDPTVFAFFSAFTPPMDDVITLLAGSDDAAEVLARNWIKARSVVWTPWVNAARSAT